ncbi:MAG: hypothetical protein AAGJ28_19880 [Pseudomonadota bacterium]
MGRQTIRAAVLASGLAVFGACTPRLENLEEIDPYKAVILLPVIEEFVTSPGKASVTLLGFQGPVRFLSRATISGRTGRAELLGDNRIITYALHQVVPGQYALHDWVLFRRRGVSLLLADSPTVTVEAGVVYYLGDFIVNNLTQTARVSAGREARIAGYKRRNRVLADVEIVDVSAQMALDCWAQDATAIVVAGNAVLEHAVAACDM